MSADMLKPHDQDLSHGSIRKEMWSLAWPTMLSIFFYTLYNLVDAYWVSKISAEAIAAVGISQITLFIMISLGFGITVGSGVLMAMNIGAKNKKEAERILGQSFVLSAILGIVFTIIALTFKNQLLTFSGASGLIFAPALEYYTITAAGSILLFIMMAVMFAFNSQGDTSTLTKLFAISTLVNTVLDPIMIFGWLGFPKLGIGGAAIATLVSQAIFIAIAIKTLSSPKRQIRFHFKNLNMKLDSVKRVLKIGFPAALTQVISPIGLSILTLIVSLSFLEPGTIALSLGLRVDFFAFLPAVGFSVGAMAMIGQSIGAGNIERAKRAYKHAMIYAFLGATGMGMIAALLSKPIIGIFTADPVVTQNAMSYLLTVTLSYGFMAAVFVQASAFQATGRSWPGFWISFLRVGIMAIPLGYVFSAVFGFSIISVWVAIIIANVASSIIGHLWIRRSLSRIRISDIPVQH